MAKPKKKKESSDKPDSGAGKILHIISDREVMVREIILSSHEFKPNTNIRVYRLHRDDIGINLFPSNINCIWLTPPNTMPLLVLENIYFTPVLGLSLEITDNNASFTYDYLKEKPESPTGVRFYNDSFSEILILSGVRR